MTSTFSPNLNMELQATGDGSGIWGQSLNNNVLSVLDAVLGNTLALPLTNINVTLTTTQTQNAMINLTGTLTANVQIIFPNIGRTFLVRNSCTGAFTVTLKTVAAGATITAPQGQMILVALSGGNVYSDTLGFTPVQQGGGAGQGTNKIYIGYGAGAIYLQVDSTSFGSTWPISITGNAGYASSAGSVGGVSSPATHGAIVQYQSGVAEIGSVPVDGNGVYDLPAPYVMTGLRSDSSPGYGNIYLRCRALYAN